MKNKKNKLGGGSKTKISMKELKKAGYVLKYIRPHIGYFIFAMILLVFGSLVFMVVMGIPGEMANVAAGQPRFDLGLSINDYGLILIVLLLVQGLFSYLRTVSFAIVSERGMADLRKDLYDKLMVQPLSFYEKHRVGELTSRITTDVEQLQSVFSITLAEFIRQIVILVAGISIIFYWTPKLALIMLATFPIVVISAMFFGKYIRKLSRKRQDQLAESNTIVEETLQSFHVVKAFANEWYESLRYKKAVDKVVDTSIKFARIKGLFFSFVITILFGGIFFILYRGALMVEKGEMEIGDLFSFIIYTGILGGAIAGFGNLFSSLASALGATERVRDILNRNDEVEISDIPDDPTLPISGDILYKDVRFSYPTRKDVEVLHGINLHVKKGQSVALVGQSGSGKSTIVSLLMRFYDIDSGDIFIDGRPIEEYNVTALRKSIGIVPQEVILFGGTLRENILYGNPNASEDEMIAAARKANCLDFIESFPEGFETKVGDRGVKLSGGQRQRVAIARAILKNPKILILDEATSSLDAESEKSVQEAINHLMEGRTSIIIAHRLATIRSVDHIYVLSEGQIIEQGNHRELMDQKGIYYSLAQLQFG